MTSKSMVALTERHKTDQQWQNKALHNIENAAILIENRGVLGYRVLDAYEREFYCFLRHLLFCGNRQAHLVAESLLLYIC